MQNFVEFEKYTNTFNIKQEVIVVLHKLLPAFSIIINIITSHYYSIIFAYHWQVQDFRFLCPNGTAFDQEAQICADWGDVDCEQTVLYYGSDNFDLYRLSSGFESKRAPLADEEEATFHLQRAESGKFAGTYCCLHIYTTKNVLTPAFNYSFISTLHCRRCAPLQRDTHRSKVTPRSTTKLHQTLWGDHA